MKLSLLDRSRTRAGEDDGAALRNSVGRAVRAESLGFHRFWVAEHHGVPGVASGAPAVLLGAIGQATEHMRVGSGGVMLPHHQPLVVAEQFLLLAGLFPGRIDLGLGRSPGFTRPVREALRAAWTDAPVAEAPRGSAPVGTSGRTTDRRADASARDDRFAADLAEVRDLLTGTGTVTARPQVASAQVPGMFVLATGKGMTVAAELGLPVVIGGPLVRDPELESLVRMYRRNFRPAAVGVSRPQVIVSADVFIAGSRAEARDLALPEAWAMARSRETGEFGPLESPAAIHEQVWSARTRERVEKALASPLIGTADTVVPEVERILAAAGSEELLLSTSTFDLAALEALDQVVAATFG